MKYGLVRRWYLSGFRNLAKSGCFLSVSGGFLGERAKNKGTGYLATNKRKNIGFAYGIFTEYFLL
jgi:hypothetical protein